MGVFLRFKSNQKCDTDECSSLDTCVHLQFWTLENSGQVPKQPTEELYCRVRGQGIWYSLYCLPGNVGEAATGVALTRICAFPFAVLPSFEVKLRPESPFFYVDSEDVVVNIKAM